MPLNRTSHSICGGLFFLCVVPIFTHLSLANGKSVRGEGHDDEFKHNRPLPRGETLIWAYLKMHQIFPKVVPVPAKDAIEVSYKEDAIVDFGLELTEDQVENQPINTTWPVEKGAHYTLILFTPDSPSRLNQTEGQFDFWFVANINESCKAKSGNTYTEYLGPKAWTMNPELLGELRRYIFIVFKQPVKPLLYRMGITYKEYYDSRQRFNVTEFADEYKLGRPVAINMFQMSTVKQKRNWTVMPDWHKNPMKYITMIDEPPTEYPHQDYE
nr:PREDICTED: protein D1-like [Bemisia tabaci]